MDLFKAITGKNPAEYENAAKVLVNTPDIELFKKLVKQDDFLFDFIKSNVARRIQNACNQENYKNLLKFLDYYSPSYDSVIAEILNQFGGNEIYNIMENYYISGNNSQKTYAAKYFLFSKNEQIKNIIDDIRKNAESEDDYLCNNSIEVLSMLNDNVSKINAINKLSSDDEFKQYEGVKFLVTYQAKDSLELILNVMKNSSLAENIAYEIPSLITLDELIEQDFDATMLILCNIISGIPEIISPTAICDNNITGILEYIYEDKLTSTSALVLRMAQDKFASLTENEEYLFDCDKNTKDAIVYINKFLSKIDRKMLNSMLYEELYEDSDFVFFALDFADNIEEIETLLDSSNQTLIVKAISRLKEKKMLSPSHKDTALSAVTNENIRNVILAL